MTEFKGGLHKGDNYAVAHVGEFAGLHDYKFQVGPYTFPGKVFLKDALGLTGMEVSLGRIEPGQGVPYSHRHKENEELYLFIKGKGQFLIDGEVVDVQEGSMIRVAPNGVRAWRNHSTEPLDYIVIQAKESTLGQYTLNDGEIIDPRVKWPE